MQSTFCVKLYIVLYSLFSTQILINLFAVNEQFHSLSDVKEYFRTHIAFAKIMQHSELYINAPTSNFYISQLYSDQS